MMLQIKERLSFQINVLEHFLCLYCAPAVFIAVIANWNNYGQESRLKTIVYVVI